MEAGLFIYLFNFCTEWVSVERCFRTYFSFCDFVYIYYGFLRTPWGSLVLVELMLMTCNFINNGIFYVFTGVSVERCFRTYFSFCDFVFIYYGFLRTPWGSLVLVELMLMTCNFINNGIFYVFTGLLSVGECISSKSNG